LYQIGVLNDAIMGLQTAIGVAASFLPGSGLYDAFRSIKVIASGKGEFMDALNVVAVALPLAKGASKLFGTSALSKMVGWFHRSCKRNSFVAGTLVDTPEGQRPIESLQVGDEVITRDEQNPYDPPKVGIITGIMRGWTTAVLWLTLANGQMMGVTPGHGLWTYERGWVPAAKLCLGDTLQGPENQPIRIIEIALDWTYRPVYNLEVEGTFTYFVEGVWVHNAKICQLPLFEGHHVLPIFL